MPVGELEVVVGSRRIEGMRKRKYTEVRSGALQVSWMVHEVIQRTDVGGDVRAVA